MEWIHPSLFLVLADVTTNPPAVAPGPTAFTVATFGLVLVFTLLWDSVDLWIRYRWPGCFVTADFWLYTAFHFVIGLGALWLVSRSVAGPEWLKATLATVSTQTVFSNANITFGQANLLPIGDKLRAFQDALRQRFDKVLKAKRRQLHGRASALPLKILERELFKQLVTSGAGATAQAEINKAKAVPGVTEDNLRIQFAWDLIAFDEYYVSEQIAAWEAE